MTATVKRLRRLGDVSAAVCAALGFVGLAGFTLDLPALRSLLPFGAQMKANAAVGLIAAGAAAFAAGERDDGRPRSTALARLAGLFLFALGAATALQYHLRADLGIDQLLFREPPGAPGTVSPNRMAQASAVSFALAGFALVAGSLGRRLGQAAQVAAGAQLALGATGFFGYVFGASLQAGDGARMALHTALAFVALGVALFCARPGQGAMALVSSAGPGGALVRRLLPLVVVVLTVAGSLSLTAYKAGWLGPDTGPATQLVARLFAISGVLLLIARSVDRTELRFRQSFESPMAAKALWTPDGRVIDANARLLELLGLTREEVAAGALRADGLPLPEDAAGQVEQLVGRGPQETQFRSRTGERLTLLVAASAPKNGIGSYFLLDVTAHKRADERLRRLQRDEQEQALLRLQRQLLAGIGAARDLDESLAAALRAVAEATGAAHAEAWLPTADGLSRSPASYSIDPARFARLNAFGPTQGASANGASMRALKARRPIWIEDLGTLDTERGALARAAGLTSVGAVPVLSGDEIAAVLVFGFAARRDGDGRFMELVAAAGQEVGQALRRKRSEDELRASELRFRSVAHSASDAIISLDDRGVVTSWNRAAELIFGRTEAEMIGRNLEVVMPERYRHGHRKGLERVRNGGVPRVLGQRIELAGLRADGREFPVEMSIGSWSSQKGRFFTGILRDISDRKRAENELQKVNDGLRRTVAELEARNREAAELGLLAELLQSCGSVKDALRVLSDRLPRVFPGSSGAVLLAAPSKNLFETGAVFGERDPGDEVFGAGDCWALRRGRPHRGGEGGSVACAHAHDAAEPRVCVGLQAGGEAVGLLTLRWERGAPPAGDASLERVLTAATDQIALALANLKLRDTLKMQAVRDPLTGLYNRRHLEEALDRELRRAQRKSRLLSVVMVDVDHFKRLNDEHGHAVGDVVLREVARMLQSAVRGDDVVCRYGGEEFTVVLPEASLADAVRRAEHMRERAKELRITVADGREVGVTASFGVAAFPTHGREPAALLACADRALYAAKAAGRDRVVAAEEPASNASVA